MLGLEDARTLTIALMAAILEAGDRARYDPEERQEPSSYVLRAIDLLESADATEPDEPLAK